MLLGAAAFVGLGGAPSRLATVVVLLGVAAYWALAAWLCLPLLGGPRRPPPAPADDEPSPAASGSGLEEPRSDLAATDGPRPSGPGRLLWGAVLGADLVVLVVAQLLLADADLLPVATLVPVVLAAVTADERGLDHGLRLAAVGTTVMAALHGFGPGPEPTGGTLAAVVGAGGVACWAAVMSASGQQARERLVAERSSLEQLKEQVVTTVSHELRTPLTIIQGLTSTLVSRWDVLPETRRLDLIDSLGVNVASLDASVLHFLDAGRLSKGGWQVRPSLVRVAPIIDEVMTKLEPILAGYDVQRRLEAQEVWADPEALERVLELLLVNACRFSPPAGAITVRVLGTSITGWEVSVADRGQGIGPDDLPKVFDRLWRGDVADTGVSRGAGLGLAIVKELAERHGGTAAAASRKGRGSTFRIHFPPPPPGSAAG